MYMPLFDYPRDFLVALLTQFLDLFNVANLDTALCKRDHRKRLLELLGSKDVSFSNSNSNSNNKDMQHQQLRWCALRVLRLQSLSVFGYRRRSVDVPSEVVAVLAKNAGSALKSLHLQDYKNGFTAVHFLECCSSCADIEQLSDAMILNPR